ncbi:MAG: zinc-ribbon domain-containing protein [Phycisphaerae bacterium]|nr:zinc-ribbon domain-containing protein [Phycisphaerae bacterium]
MSIEFNCPKCNALIAFPERHAGKRARCATCDHRFVIPEVSFQKPGRTAQPKEPVEQGDPLPGFYGAALIGSWGVLFKRDARMGLVLICAAVCFKFYVAHVDYSFVIGPLSIILPFGLIVRVLCWGIIFWYYLESIMLGALDVDGLPDVDIDGYVDFLKKSIASVFAFIMAVLVCTLPTTLYLIFAGQERSPLISNILANAGLFFLPMCLVAVAVNQDTQVLWRVDTLFKPVTRAFIPYLTCAAMIMLVWFLQMRMHNAGDPALAKASTSLKTLYLSMHLGIQVLALVAMRSLGLYYRHYQCFFKW